MLSIKTNEFPGRSCFHFCGSVEVSLPQKPKKKAASYEGISMDSLWFVAFSEISFSSFFRKAPWIFRCTWILQIFLENHIPSFLLNHVAVNTPPIHHGVYLVCHLHSCHHSHSTSQWPCQQKPSTKNHLQGPPISLSCLCVIHHVCLLRCICSHSADPQDSPDCKALQIVFPGFHGVGFRDTDLGHL